MSRLTFGSTLDTKLIMVMRQVVPRKVVFNLLDGSDVVQVIGDAPEQLVIDITAIKGERDIIDSLDISGGLVTVIDDDGISYNGRIIDKGMWSRFSSGYYQTTFTVSVEVS
ncbi:MAG TPA: hypothetical protein DIT32_03445 [Peptococcaceae bacterium]|nr:hypothetical protein [Peptococcaceae bacterium]